MPRPLRKRVTVYYREVRIRLKAFRVFLITFFVVTLTGAFALTLKYSELSPTEAYYQAVTMMFFASTLDYPRGDLLYEIMWIVYPVFGLILLADGLTGIGVSLKFGDVTSEEWNLETVKIMDDHIILVGIGNLGIRILNNLLDERERLVIIDKMDESVHEEVVQDFQITYRIPVIKGEAQYDHVLEQAGIENAAAMVICIDDDFLNLKIAMKARKMNPKIKIIARIFDIEFGEEIAAKLNLTLLSTTKIAVGTFIEKLQENLNQPPSFKVE